MISHTHLATTHSTNSQLIDWICQNFTDPSPQFDSNAFDYQQPHLLTADSQTSGRGQHGRQWQSPQGNVYLSLYIPVKKSLSPLESEDYRQQEQDLRGVKLVKNLDGRLSLCVGYQLAKIPMINQLNQARVSENLPKIGVKWVNDLGFYEGQIFHKLAGILIEPVSVENQLLGVVVGVGMNVLHTPDLSKLTQTLPYQAVSIAELSSKAQIKAGWIEPSDAQHNSLQSNHDLTEFYHHIQTAICHAISQFNGFATPQNVSQFIQDFAQVDVLYGKTLQIILPMMDAASVIGQAIGIDNNASLQILQNDGTIMPIWTGTVQVLP